MPLPTIAQKSSLPVVRSQDSIGQPWVYDRFLHGLNTSLPANLIRTTELAAAVNFALVEGGSLEARASLYSHISTTVTTTPSPKCHVQIPISGTNRELMVYGNNELYWNNSGTPTHLGTLEGEPKIFPYKGVALICDGSYLKFLNGVTSSNLNMAYDSGTGTRGFQFDKRALTSDVTMNVGDGTTTRIAYKFTSTAWTAGWTIPPTTVHAKLSKTGSPTGNLVMAVRLAADSSVMATKTMLAVNTLTSTETSYTGTFLSTDVTTELSTATDYYCSLEYDNGNATNYVTVHCNNIGTGGKAYGYAAAAWTAATSTEPLMALRPGVPPKATDGRVKDTRVFLIGDPDRKGGAAVSNTNTYLDFSTANQGGFIGATDNDNNTYEVGAIEILYSNLYFYGTKELPYISQLTGSTPADYAIPVTFQRIGTTRKCIASVINDIWSVSKDGVDNLKGVEQYGDLRNFSNSDPIGDRIRDYFDETTDFIEYFPQYGQLFLVMASYHRVLVCHVKIPSPDPSSQFPQKLRYPWMEYEFYLRDLTDTATYKWTATGTGNEYSLEAAAGGNPSIAIQPDALTLDGKKITEGTAGSLSDHGWDYATDPTSSFPTVYFCDASGDPDTSGVEIRQLIIPTSLSSFSNVFYVGSSDGKFYKFSDSYYKDLNSIQTFPKFRTARTEFPLRQHRLEQFQIIGGSRYGSQFTVNLHIDGLEAETAISDTYKFPISDDITVDEATMIVDDALFAVDASGNPLWNPIWIKCNAMQWEIKNVYQLGSKVSFNGLIVEHKQLAMK